MPLCALCVLCGEKYKAALSLFNTKLYELNNLSVRRYVTYQAELYGVETRRLKEQVQRNI